ncbi:MAG: FHA domain-containing protein [Lachnospiraceae bacterium]|nr:FHA domain-containing protein [Lachnospiraceae bacterium]
MQIAYKRNGLKNYLVIKKERSEEAGLHEKMMVRNRISYLARMTPQSIDGNSYYYYDIQGRVSLYSLYEGRSFTANEIHTLLNGLYGMLSELQRYMLSLDEVILDPSVVWLLPDTLEPSFIYVPGVVPDPGYGIRALAEFLTEHVDGSDREAAEIAYEYLRMVDNGYVFPESDPVPETASRGSSVTETGDVKTKEELPISHEEYWDLKEGLSEEMKPFFEEDKGKRNAKTPKMLYICLGVAIFAAAVYIALVLEPSLFPIYLNDEEYTIIGIIIAVAFAIVLIAVMYFYNTGRPGAREREDPHNTEAEEDITEQAGYGSLDEIEYMEYEESKKETEDERTMLLKKPGYCRSASPMPTLIYDDGRHIVIHTFPCLLGKMRSRVDEVIEGEGISRIHAMIKEQEGRYYISDMNSLNGTGVNGRLLESNQTVEISGGDIIALADTELTFQT